MFDPNVFQTTQFQTALGAPPETPKEPPVATLHAISGLTRSAMARSDSWPLNQWLIINVGGALIPHFVHDGEDLAQSGIEQGSIIVTDNQNQTQDTCGFTIWGTPPTPGKLIIIAAGTYANRLFGGAVQSITQLPMKPGWPEPWQVDCTDWWYFANRRRVFAKYLTFPADQILKDIISRFTSGFTWNHVKAAPNITGGIEFNGDTMMSAVSAICNRIGWECYIDAHRDFHFFDLEDTNAIELVPGRYHYWDLSFRENIAQLRNRVFQTGGGGVTTAQVLAGASAIPLDVLTWYPTSGPNMRVQVGGQIIPYTSVGASSLAVTPGVITHVIPQGTEVGIFVQVDDLESQARIAVIEGEGSDGVHEYTADTDRRLGEEGAIEKATAEMREYNAAALSGDYRAYDPDARSGRMVHMTLPYRGVSLRGKRFMITSVQTTVKAPKRYFERSISFGTTEKLDIYTALRGGAI